MATSSSSSSRPLVSASTPLLAGHSAAAATEPTVASSFRAVVTTNLAFNIAAAIFFPLGILAEKLAWGDQYIFWLNFAAIVPLAKSLDFATDQLSMRVGQTLGGLLNASFGNAVELILGVMTLRAGLLRVLQASLIGSILSNLLLVLGFCFLCGGLFPFRKNGFQSFNLDNANLDAGLLAVVSLGLVVPATMGGDDDKIIGVSRGAAIVLFTTYVGYLIFHLYTNPLGLMFEAKTRARRASRGPLPEPVVSADVENCREEPEAEQSDEEEEKPITLGWVALLQLVVTTLLISASAELLVGSLEGLSEEAHLTESFIGIVILPIVGNAAEHVTAVSSAMRNKMDLAIEVAIGSSMQIALFVTPLLVLAGWAVGQPLTLNFGIFETAVLVASVFVVNALIFDGRSHWLEGWMLLASYIIIALAFYY
ncbi:Sodium/calcium exchanger protein-domain-containing protein [Zopfochytrium polystomum]|nr:Sodium/calcium exchanger protein-domain-containing protein [Zopfochytrium polystomum]